MKRRIAFGMLAALLLLTLCLTGCAKKDAGYTVLAEPLTEEQFAIGFRKDDKALCQAVEQALVEMKEDGSLKKIDEKWFGKEVSLVDAANVTQNVTDDSLNKIKEKGKFVLGLTIPSRPWATGITITPSWATISMSPPKSASAWA